MPLEVVDVRDECPDILLKRASWDSAGTKESAVVRRILKDVRNAFDRPDDRCARARRGASVTVKR
jgi:hypothetical protein